MKCKVTKVMTKELQKAFPNYHFDYVEMSVRQYELHVDYNSLSHENDYDYKRGIMKVIRVDYPWEYYAMPTYLTTNDLIRCLRGARSKTVEEFMKSVWNEIAI